MKLSDFSLLKEDTESYTIGHPKGKSMSVPKRGLSDQAQKLISKLRREQHFDEGTPEGTEEESIPIAPFGQQQESIPLAGIGQPKPIPTPSEQLLASYSPPGPVIEPPPEAKVTEAAEKAASGEEKKLAVEEPKAPVQPQMPQMAHAAPTQPPVSALEQAQKDIRSGVSAQARAGREEAAAYGEQQKALAGIQKSYDDHYKELTQKGQKLEQAIANHQIDPDRWYNNQSTGSKIASAIGLVFSGLGAGITGGPNLVQQNIDRSISNDIASQQADHSNKMNLWKMNREMMGSDLQATMATQNQMLMATKSKVAQAASMAQGPMAQQAAAQTMASIGQQIDLNHWALSRLGSGQPGTETQHLAEMDVMGKLNPAAAKEMKGNYIPNVGTTRHPPSEKQREELIAYDNFEKAFNRAEEFQRTKAGSLGTFKGSALNAEAEAIKTALDISMGHLAGLNRMSDTDLHEFQKITPNVGSFFSANALAKLHNLRSVLSEQKGSLNSAIGLTPFKKAPTDDQARAWLMQNPNDPNAAMVAQTLLPQNQPTQVASGGP